MSQPKSTLQNNNHHHGNIQIKTNHKEAKYKIAKGSTLVVTTKTKNTLGSDKNNDKSPIIRNIIVSGTSSNENNNNRASSFSRKTPNKKETSQSSNSNANNKNNYNNVEHLVVMTEF